MIARGSDILGRRIDAGHLRTHPREQFGEQSRPATDIERAPSGQCVTFARIDLPMRVDLVADVREPHGVQLVQHRRRPVRIPADGGERAALGGFVRVARGGTNVSRGGTVPRAVPEIRFRAYVNALDTALTLQYRRQSA